MAVEFVFGNDTVVWQNYMMYARRPIDKQKNVATAQGRTDPNQNTWILIHNSWVMVTLDLAPMLSKWKTFLGRPRKEYSCTICVKTYVWPEEGSLPVASHSATQAAPIIDAIGGNAWKRARAKSEIKDMNNTNKLSFIAINGSSKNWISTCCGYENVREWIYIYTRDWW